MITERILSMNQLPVSSSPVGCFGIIVFIVVIDILQYLWIQAWNMLKDMMYSFTSWYPLRLLFPHNSYDINFYHPLVTFVTLFIVALLSKPLHKLIIKIRDDIANYFTQTQVVSIYSQQNSSTHENNNSIRSQLLKLGLDKELAVMLAGILLLGLYFSVIAFFTINQYLYNLLFSIGIFVIILCISDPEP